MNFRRTARRLLGSAAAVVIAATIAVPVASPVAAAPSDSPGDLDLSFAGDGTFEHTVSGNDYYRSGLVVQPDGKIVFSAEDQTGGPNQGFTVVTRLNADGTLDTSFGTGGIVPSPILTSDGEGSAIALQPDGKILVGMNDAAGDAGDTDPTSATVWRLNADGTTDTTFGTSGIASTPFEVGCCVGVDLVLQPDGGIVIASYVEVGEPDEGKAALARFTSSGVLDTTFDTDGIAVTPFIVDNETTVGLTLLPDGDLLLATVSDEAPNVDTPVLVRFNTDGSIDTGFGTAGVASTGIVMCDTDAAVNVQQSVDGGFFIGGSVDLSVDCSDVRAYVAKFDSSGALDASFGTAGTVSTSYAVIPDDVSTVLALPDGSVLLAAVNSAPGNYAITRFLADGAVDTGFGTGGTVDSGILDPITDVTPMIAMQPDGKILLTQIGTDQFYFVQRYIGFADSELTIAKSADTNPVDAASGSTVTYTVTVTNTSTEDALSPTVTDVLPAGVTAPAITTLPAGWTDLSSGSTVSASAAALAPGASVDLVYSATAGPAAEAVTNTATVTWTNNEGGMATSDATIRIFDGCGLLAKSAKGHFTDVDASNVHKAAIECIADKAITSGRTPTTYEPSVEVTRAQMATFIARLLAYVGVDLPSGASGPFTDTGATVHKASINQLFALGVLKGKTATTFEPDGLVTRAQMATFIAQGYAAAAGAPLSDGPDAFTDDNGTTHEANINRIAKAGITSGFGGGIYGPDLSTPRDQMGSFLGRLLDVFVNTAT